MSPEVTADQDRASSVGHRRAESVIAANVESVQDRLVGLAVQRVVRARNRAVLAASAGQVVSIGQSASSASLARCSAARNCCLRRGCIAMARKPRQAQNRVAARRAEAAQRGQEQARKRRTSSSRSAPKSSLHERGPRSAAKDFRR